MTRTNYRLGPGYWYGAVVKYGIYLPILLKSYLYERTRDRGDTTGVPSFLVRPA